MATISENLQILKDSTDAIKQAIVDKGGEISGDITTWASAISEISGGGDSSVGVQCFFIRATFSHPVTGAVTFDHTYTFLLDNSVVWGDCDGKSDINNEVSIIVFSLPSGTVAYGLSISDVTGEFTPTEALTLDLPLVVGKTYVFSN